MWNLLPEQERREWDNKAREEEKRYIQELRDRPDGASAEGEEAAGVSQAGDESDEEERNLLALQLPFGAHSSRGRTAPCSRRVPRRPPHAPPPSGPTHHTARQHDEPPQPDRPSRSPSDEDHQAERRPDQDLARRVLPHRAGDRALPRARGGRRGEHHQHSGAQDGDAARYRRVDARPSQPRGPPGLCRCGAAPSPAPPRPNPNRGARAVWTCRTAPHRAAPHPPRATGALRAALCLTCADELLLPPPKEEAGAAKPKPKRAAGSKKRASPAPGEGEASPAKLAREEAEAAVAAGLTEAADAVEAAQAAVAAGGVPFAAE